MGTFLLIVRILLVLVFFTGVIISFCSASIARSKKFNNDKVESRYATKVKLIGYVRYIYIF